MTLKARLDRLERQIPTPAEAARWDLSRLSDAELTDFERIVVALEEEKREPTEAEDIRLAELATVAEPDREVRQ